MQTDVRDQLAHILRRRRTELLRGAAGLESALRAFAEERESELEEGAQEAELDRLLGRLDDRERHELTEINAALDRIADGTYGRCVRCGVTIEIARLKALPEAALCLRCASAQERARATAAPARPRSGTVPPDLALLGDDEIEALLRETVEADERIDHQELRIACRRGVVHLDGAVPSESEHAMLRRVIEDVLGFREVVDRIRIDQSPWERTERSKAGRRRPPGFEPVGTDDALESAEEGIPFVPADRPLPEEE